MRKTIKKALSIGIKAARMTSRELFSQIKKLKAKGITSSHAKKLAVEVQREAKTEAKRLAKALMAEAKHGMSVARRIKNKAKSGKSRKSKKSKRRR